MLVLLIVSLFVFSCSSTIRFSSSSNDHYSYKSPTLQKESPSFEDELLDSLNDESFDSESELSLHSTGKASFYGNKFNGRKTASGERFDNSKYTAAHKKLPFGTVIVVENVANKKRVTVRINDRGPFTKNRILDVSLQAAKELDFVRQGTATIRIYTKKNK